MTFNMDSDNNVHTIEALPEEVGQQAVAAISNLIEASRFDENTEKITKTISELVNWRLLINLLEQKWNLVLIKLSKRICFRDN